MKDELIKLVAEKTGLTEDIAKIAVDTVLGFLKEKLPAPVAAQLDLVLNSDDLAGLGKSLGGLFG